MSDILNAAEVRSGTWGELWLDGEQVAECYGCQIKVNKTAAARWWPARR